jgi:hypothetical protein
MRYRIIILLFFLSGAILSGQDTTRVAADSLPNRFYLLENIERDGVTMPEIELDEVNVVRRMGLKGRFHWWKYRRLVYNVKKVYPYAVMVRESIAAVNDTLTLIDNDRDRRRFIKDYEKSVFEEYEDDMRQMTITQGKILIKLIDRETQNTGYDLIKEYRSAVSAVFWQGIARIFGTNLKDRYDRDGDDYMIEKIIYELEAGRL